MRLGVQGAKWKARCKKDSSCYAALQSCGSDISNPPRSCFARGSLGAGFGFGGGNNKPLAVFRVSSISSISGIQLILGDRPFEVELFLLS